jgi:Probable zinc-ribbon domain
MSYADKALTCRDCGQTFTFTVSEQQFLAEKGFENEPSRCPECRAEHKASSGQRRFSSRPPRELQMVDVTCSACGKPT